MAFRVMRVVLACTCAGALAACEAPWRHEMQDQPSLASTHSPRHPADGTRTTTGELRLDRASAEPIVRTWPIGGKTEFGRTLYDLYCVPCHGLSATGDGPVASHFDPAMHVRPADLTSAAVQGHTDGWMYGTITNGTRYMPAYHYELTPAERWEIVRFMRTFGTGAR
jgi:hypothetical protein